jgi:N6-adenosine-specific RNA methylase IME4
VTEHQPDFFEAGEDREGIPLPTVEGGFRTILADPDWPFDDMGSRITPGYLRAEKASTIEDIINLPVQAIRAESSHLYLWVPDAHVEVAFEVVRRWGFEYKHLIHWIKRAPAYLEDGPPGELHIGMGHYWRHAAETLLFAAAGGCPVLRHDQANVIEAPRRKHSEKPEKLQDIIETMSPGPWAELYARRHREGWECWGNEL